MKPTYALVLGLVTGFALFCLAIFIYCSGYWAGVDSTKAAIRRMIESEAWVIEPGPGRELREQ